MSVLISAYPGGAPGATSNNCHPEPAAMLMLNRALDLAGEGSAFVAAVRNDEKRIPWAKPALRE